MSRLVRRKTKEVFCCPKTILMRTLQVTLISWNMKRNLRAAKPCILHKIIIQAIRIITARGSKETKQHMIQILQYLFIFHIRRCRRNQSRPDSISYSLRGTNAPIGATSCGAVALSAVALAVTLLKVIVSLIESVEIVKSTHDSYV